jgi:threonyl-tRNA synthetase
LAQAVKRLYPEIKLAIGPAIENGFYYDFDAETSFSPEELNAIEKEMEQIIKENLPVERFILPRDEALAFMEEKQEPYKVELIEVPGADHFDVIDPESKAWAVVLSSVNQLLGAGMGS